MNPNYNAKVDSKNEQFDETLVKKIKIDYDP